MRLSEFGDLSWVPSLYHIYLRKYLVFFYKLFGYYKLWVPCFTRFLEQTAQKTYMECCSGAGDPLPLIVGQTENQTTANKKFLLSDIQPHSQFTEHFNNNEDSPFHYIESSIDITLEQNNHPHPKIFINSFHHLTPEQVDNLLINNLKNGYSLLILEYVRKTPMGYLSMLISPLIIALTLPFVVSPRHLPVMALFTYLLPLFPLMLLWDGIISCAHEYNGHDLEKIVEKNQLKANINWTIKRSLFYPAGVSCIIVQPKLDIT